MLILFDFIFKVYNFIFNFQSPQIINILSPRFFIFLFFKSTIYFKFPKSNIFLYFQSSQKMNILRVHSFFHFFFL